MSRFFDELLRVRGFDGDFLNPVYEGCRDPRLLPDMKKAVERIRQAVSQGEKVLIYGDYDVDGVTASTVMYDALRLSGVDATKIEVMLPNRFTDGYGMSRKCVERAKEWGAKLVVTVDCGSRNHEVIEELSRAGVDVVVTDHHECGETLPEAVAVVNPKRSDSLSLAIAASETVTTPSQDAKSSSVRCSSLPSTSSTLTSSEDVKKAVDELRELAGAGVAFKVAQALVLEGMIPKGQEKWLLDLVLIGTVCDSMRMTGENRRLCFYGMKVLEKTRRLGLKELIRVAGAKRLGGEAIGFQLGPRLNAAGRMETAEHALRLLMAEKRTEAANLALVLNKLNETRRDQQNAATKEIDEQGVGVEPVIVVRGEWHEGVLGIIAGRLVEEYGRPAIALSEVDGVLKGSGRSFGEFNLAEALNVCKEYIIGGGGHAEACGLKVETGKFEDFRRAVNEYYRRLGLVEQERFLGVQEDLEVREFEELSLELLEELRRLEPFGTGNTEPVFLLREVRVVEASKMGAEGEHLRLVVWDQQGQSMKLVRFRAPEEYLRLQGGETVNVWIQLVENEFRGIRSVEGRILKLAVC